MSALVQDLVVPVTAHDPHRLADIARDREAVEAFRCDSRSLMALGEKLFRLAFPRDVDVLNLANELATAVRSSATLRLWIRAEDSAVAALPWEYLCLTADAVESCKLCGLKIEKHQPNTSLPDERPFLSLHPNVSLVRQSGDVSAGGELTRIDALRVLIVWADPNSSLWGSVSGLEGEVVVIERILRALPHSHVEVSVLAHATPDALRQRMMTFRPHVLHYCGHGAFPMPNDPPGAATEPSLVLEGVHTAAGRQHAYLGGAELRQLCAAAGVQVVVLNCCLGAKSSVKFSGLARTLTAPGEGRVPVVVAHQMEVPQAAAAGFARPFYQNLIAGEPVEAGVQPFRAECEKARPDGADWGIPVVSLGVSQTKLFHVVRPDSTEYRFEDLVRRHVTIVGREFIRTAFADFQRERESGIFLITGPPGIGKTAFLAQMCADEKEVVRYFYGAGTGDRTNPDRWVEMTYKTLLGRHGLIDATPTNDDIERRARLGRWLLDEVSAKCVRLGKREVILVDALDESEKTRDNKSAVDVLPETLPAGVYLVITARPGPLATTLLRRADVKHLVIEPTSTDNRNDAIKFCERELRDRINDADEPGLRRLCATLAERAESNFLVLRLFLNREPLRGRTTLADVMREAASLTKDVRNEYEKFMERAEAGLEDDSDGLGKLDDVLGALATAREPVTQTQLMEAFALRRRDWDPIMRRVAQFLLRGRLEGEEEADTFRIYHATFREFLSDRLKGELRTAHERWADHAWEWRSLEGHSRRYALRHLVRHLIASAKKR